MMMEEGPVSRGILDFGRARISHRDCSFCVEHATPHVERKKALLRE